MGTSEHPLDCAQNFSRGSLQCTQCHGRNRCNQGFAFGSDMCGMVETHETFLCVPSACFDHGATAGTHTNPWDWERFCVKTPNEQVCPNVVAISLIHCIHQQFVGCSVSQCSKAFSIACEVVHISLLFVMQCLCIIWCGFLLLSNRKKN